MAVAAMIPVHHNHHHEHHVPGCRTRTCDRHIGRWLGRLERRRRPHLSAGASWYDDAGGTACGFHAKLGVANKDLPCHTRVELCASHCAVVEVQDRGPFVAGRDWDLNPGAREATGFGDTGQVHYRVLSSR